MPVRRRDSIRHYAARLALAWLTVLVLGGIPASVLVRPVVFERSAPPLPPDAEGRDAVVVATARDPSGEPLGGARVRVFSLRRASHAEPPRAYAAGEGTTGKDGVLRLERLPRGETWITAEREGRARASASVVLGAAERAVTLTLDAEHRLDVKLEDEAGRPIAGAEVEIAQADPLPVGARAGADGVAHVTRLGPSPWAVTARAAGFDEVTTRGVREGGPLRVVLRRMGAIVARVVDEAGRSVSPARVQIASPVLWPARMADVGPKGEVRIGSLPAGTYALRAVAGERASAIEDAVGVERGEEKTVTLRLGPSETVAVRVKDDDDAPVSGARVTLAEAGVSPFPVEATTDGAGRARLGPISRGPATLTARAEGYVPRGAVAVPDPLAGEVPIVLARAGAIEGRVVDARGFPIGGATIEIVGTAFDGAPIDDDPRRSRFTEAQFASALAGPRPLVSAGELGVMPGPVPKIPAIGAPIAGGGPVAPAEEPWVSRGDGTFRAAPASPGRVRALVHHPQYVDAVSDLVTLVPGGTATLEVVLRAGGTLEGRVVDVAGHGVEGARVVMAATRGLLERVARTASDGSFGFAAVPGEVVLLASPDDEGSPPEARAVVKIPEGGKAEITLTLPPARDPLPAHVKDDRGDPVDDAQITVASLDAASALRETAFTDDHGDATLLHARGLALRAEVLAPGRAPSVMKIDPAATSLEVTLAAAESATGEIRSSRGDRLAGAEVAFYGDTGVRRARTDDDGGFTLTELAAGQGELVVRAPGYARASRPVTIEPQRGRRPTPLGRIELTRGGAVEGLVLDGRGDPIPGARVAKDLVPTYLAVGKAPPGLAVTDAHGRFLLPDLPDGDVTLEAYAPDSGRARREVRIAAGETTRDMRFTLVPDEGTTGHEPAAAGSLAVTLGETGDPPQVIVAAVAEGSLAERAGLAPMDVVVAIGGAPVESMEQARARMSGPLGDDVLLTVRRQDKTETVRVPREPVRR